MYDIIGDIHGHADELWLLLDSLGYRQTGGAYRHPSRRAVFVGDFIDRGPQIQEVLETVRHMCDSGSALAVMGNHEFNALAFHTPSSSREGGHLRRHSDKNKRQHAATTAQLSDGLMAEYLEWFRTLPMWLEVDGMRVVHACWDDELINVLERERVTLGGVSDQFLHEATAVGSELFKAIDDVLKGKEIKLPEGMSYADKDGNPRNAMRIQWYRSPSAETYASYALTADDGLPDVPIPEEVAKRVDPYPANAPPVFFGHYWLRGDRPARLAPNVACLDYSVAKGGSLCAYRWDGEPELSDDKFVVVKSHQR